MSEEIADLLDSTADLIEEHGWTRRSFYREGEGFCLLGGLLQAQGASLLEEGPLPTGEVSWTIRDPFRKGVQALRPYLDGASPMRWNDLVAKDKQEVLDVLRKAAKDQRRHR